MPERLQSIESGCHLSCRRRPMSLPGLDSGAARENAWEAAAPWLESCEEGETAVYRVGN